MDEEQIAKNKLDLENQETAKRSPLIIEPLFEEPRFEFTWWNGDRLRGSCLVSALVLAFLLPVVSFLADLVLSWLVQE